jgi:hypothetical protein
VCRRHGGSSGDLRWSRRVMSCRPIVEKPSRR